MTKAALNAFTRSLTVEYGPFGILANTLCPGYVDSAMTRQNNTPQEIEAISGTIPLRRVAQPEEIARVAYFLCSDENTYITGQEIVADGGFLCATVRPPDHDQERPAMLIAWRSMIPWGEAIRPPVAAEGTLVLVDQFISRALRGGQIQEANLKCLPLVATEEQKSL